MVIVPAEMKLIQQLVVKESWVEVSLKMDVSKEVVRDSERRRKEADRMLQGLGIAHSGENNFEER